MRKQVMVEKTQFTCDGCQYLMSQAQVDDGIKVVVPFDYSWMELREERELEFHFHTLSNRHDCFRYWAHNPDVMTRSLRDRKLDDEEIDQFLSLMLYRKHSWSPGLARPEAS